MQPKNPRLIEAEEKLLALLVEYSDIFGPDDEDLSDDGLERREIMPTEWVVVANWSAFESGMNMVFGAAASHMLFTHVLGLVTYAMEEDVFSG